MFGHASVVPNALACSHADDIALDDRAFIETEGAVEQLSTMMGSQMSLDERPESAEPSSRLYWLSIYGDIPPAVERALAGGLSGEALLETPVEVIAYVSTFEDWSQGLRYREERKPVVSRPIEIRKSKRGLQVTGCVQARHVAQVKASSKGLRFAQPLLGPATVTATSPAKTSDCANLHLNLPASQPVGEKVDGAWTPLPAGEQRPPCTPSEEAASVLGGPSSFGRPNRLDFGKRRRL